jgi:hypothetical protein
VLRLKRRAALAEEQQLLVAKYGPHGVAGQPPSDGCGGQP